MITPVNIAFNEWLTLMKKLYKSLTKEEFKELEDKIVNEIKNRQEN